MDTQPVKTEKPRILICDDDIEYSQEMMEALTARGYSAAALMTISDARAAILAPSVLLIDLCMPERSAIDIAKILGTHERKDYFKIVLISGCSEYVIGSVAKQFEARGLRLLGTFQKPVDVTELSKLLEASGA